MTWRLGVLATWRLKKSHVVTTVSRQAVECEARSPCIHDRNIIKVLKARQRHFLSHLRRFDFFLHLILQGFRTACFITCLGTAAPDGAVLKLLNSLVPQSLTPSVPHTLIPSIPQKLSNSATWRLGVLVTSTSRTFVPHSLASLHQ